MPEILCYSDCVSNTFYLNDLTSTISPNTQYQTPSFNLRNPLWGGNQTFSLTVVTYNKISSDIGIPYGYSSCSGTQILTI